MREPRDCGTIGDRGRVNLKRTLTTEPVLHLEPEARGNSVQERFGFVQAEWLWHVVVRMTSMSGAGVGSAVGR